MFKLKPLVATERQEHLALMQWVRLQPWRRHFIHIPNEGKRDRVSGHILRCMGLTKGVSDFLLALPNARYHGLFLELKRRFGGKITPEQQDWIDLMNSVGYYACFAHGCDEAIKLIGGYMDEKKERQSPGQDHKA